MSVDNLEDKIKKLKRQRDQPATPDALGRIYNKSPGAMPYEIKYEDCQEVKEIAIEIVEMQDRQILRGFIDDEILIFKKSTGRRGKAHSYIIGIKPDVRCLVSVNWVYCIDVTPTFQELNLRDKYKVVLNQLTRIPERSVPSGSLIPYNSFTGLDYLIEDVSSLIENKQSLT